MKSRSEGPSSDGSAETGRVAPVIISEDAVEAARFRAHREQGYARLLRAVMGGEEVVQPNKRSDEILRNLRAIADLARRPVEELPHPLSAGWGALVYDCSPEYLAQARSAAPGQAVVLFRMLTRSPALFGVPPAHRDTHPGLTVPKPLGVAVDDEGWYRVSLPWHPTGEVLSGFVDWAWGTMRLRNARRWRRWWFDARGWWLGVREPEADRHRRIERLWASSPRILSVRSALRGGRDRGPQ